MIVDWKNTKVSMFKKNKNMHMPDIKDKPLRIVSIKTTGNSKQRRVQRRALEVQGMLTLHMLGEFVPIN